MRCIFLLFCFHCTMITRKGAMTIQDAGQIDTIVHNYCSRVIFVSVSCVTIQGRCKGLGVNLLRAEDTLDSFFYGFPFVKGKVGGGDITLGHPNLPTHQRIVQERRAAPRTKRYAHPSSEVPPSTSNSTRCRERRG
jgi:hypothetical protein